MPSPFPGMDPYLEAPDVWAVFHPLAIAAIGKALSQQVGVKYAVRVDENLYDTNIPDDEWNNRNPRLVHEEQQEGASARSGRRAPVYGTITLTKSRSEPFLSIVDVANGNILTKIELLTPAIKRPGQDRRVYEQRRLRTFYDGPHLVEIDLLRGLQLRIDGLRRCDYYVMVSARQERPRAGVWPLALSDRLPIVAIPLAAGEHPATLDLKAVVDSAYEETGCGRSMYERPLDPPLDPSLHSWAAALLPS